MNIKQNLSLQQKISLWERKNNEWCSALDSLNINKIEELYSNGFPKEIANYLNAEELDQLKNNEYKKLIDCCENKKFESLNMFYINEKRDVFIDILAPYLIYGQSYLSVNFRKNYFAYTKNKEKALLHLDSIINSFSYLKKESIFWLEGSLYNKSDEFFDEFQKKITNGYGEALTDRCLNLLTGTLLKDGSYYNLKSWKKQFNNGFKLFVKDMERYCNSNEIDLVNLVFFYLIDAKLKLLESEVTKKEEIKEIIDFLVEEYSCVRGINNFEFMMVGLCYEKIMEFKWFINMKREAGEILEFTNISSNTGFKLRFLNSREKELEDNLKKYIDLSISYHDAKECIYFFNSLDIKKEYYKVLDFFVELSGNMENNGANEKLIGIKKV